MPAHSTPSPYAAILRDESGEIIGTTYGCAQCHTPKRSKRGRHRFAAVDADGSETIIRCGDCPGCRELDRQRLAQRLVEHFKEFAGEIWIIVARCEPGCHRRLAAGVHRSNRTAVEPGFFLLAGDHVAFLALGKKPSPVFFRRRASSVRIEKIRRSRGRRAWAIVTAGVAAARSETFEPWQNRFYHRGLKPLARDRDWKFSARFAPGLSKTAHAGGVRAFRAGVSIHLPAKISIELLFKRRAGGQISLLSPPAKPASSSVPGFRIARTNPAAGEAGKREMVARVPSTLQTRTLNSIKRAGYQGSLQKTIDFADAWAKRMAEKARARGEPPKKPTQ
jgi:hypothetical protein